jgi:hypothetical protein
MLSAVLEEVKTRFRGASSPWARGFAHGLDPIVLIFLKIFAIPVGETIEFVATSPQ